MTLAQALIEKGQKQGIQQGVQQGIQQGVQQGIQQGVQQGLQQGRELERQKIAASLLAEGMNIEKISVLTGLSVEELRNIAQG